MDDLFDDITGLVGICHLPEKYDLTDDVSNESSEDEDSESFLCHTDTFLFLYCIIIM